MYMITKPLFYQGKRLSPECVTMLYQITIGHVMLCIAMIIMCTFITSGFFGSMESDLYNKAFNYYSNNSYSDKIDFIDYDTNIHLYSSEELINRGDLGKYFENSLINSDLKLSSIIENNKEDEISNIENIVEESSTVNEAEATTYVDPEPVVEEKVEIKNATPITSSDEYVAGTPVAVTSEALDGLVANNYYGYTKEDYDYLLMAIVGEAQHCSVTEQMYVGSVVLNRYYADSWFKYGDTIKDICLAPNQYSCFSGGGAYKTPTETNKQVAAQLLKNGSILPANVIWQSLFKQGDGVYWYFEDTGTYICYNDGMPY